MFERGRFRPDGRSGNTSRNNSTPQVVQSLQTVVPNTPTTAERAISAYGGKRLIGVWIIKLCIFVSST